MKKDLTNPLVMISFFLILATVLLFLFFYFVKPFISNSKIEVSVEDKEELELLTKAYLNQNSDINIDKLFFNINLNEYNVASEYYYLKNGQDKIDKYEEILDIAKKIFNNENVRFRNFVINLDECGKEKYSSIEGLIYEDTCDLDEMVYEISDIYKENDLYIVEFYASYAYQIINRSDNLCEKGKPFSYNLKLTNLENLEFLNNSYYKCLNEFNYGIFYLKDSILNEIKNNNYKYKLSFKKNDSYFTFYSLKK